ncbi:zinc finger protein Eos isoform X2 [Scleropages formosus]|uniref:IKAROS family zinc finger 4 n=2 Tax=Scleropages formosus TaxID=113540 RepID=A0A8C9TX58_SCLFO|nr:zinc finger protein Eos-like isoform X2 [Scleropages formosus]
MSTEDCNGRSYVSGSGDSSTEKEFSGGFGGPMASTPNSHHSSPARTHSANSVKVELFSEDQLYCSAQTEDRGQQHEEEWKDERVDHVEERGLELGGGAARDGGGGYSDLANPEPAAQGPARLPSGKLKCEICGMVCIGPNVLMVHKRSHTGERPFHCNQCGASFTQKGNLLRHIKLHSGEKPFKCPFCSYACRRRDALMGHLRTHSMSSPTMVGKVFKCSYCGRSYKQQSALEEHCERCHSYRRSLESRSAPGAHPQGEELRDAEFTADSLHRASADKLTFIDRLTDSITKRKRSTPQKFVGEKHMRLNSADAPYEQNGTGDKEGDGLSSHHGSSDASSFAGAGYLGGPAGVVAPEPIRSLRLPHQQPTGVPEFTSVISSFYRQMVPLGPRMDFAGGGAGAGGLGLGLGGREMGEGREDLPLSRSHSHIPSPSNGCQESTDSESTPEDPRVVTPPVSNSIQHPHPPPQRTLNHAKERDGEHQREDVSMPPWPLQQTPSGLRVVDGEGRPVRSFRCEHCRVLFLDHVMFTIHMGCHGFHQPFECNICGHRSQDRYEFSSHIIRGEHKVG